MISKEQKRVLLLQYLMHFIGKAYRWDGNGILGLDCSGFIGEGLKAIGLIDVDMAAKQMATLFENRKVALAQAGCLVFFGTKDAITHVGIALNEELMLEAGGGGRGMDTLEEAEAVGAMVRMRPISRRKDLVLIVDPLM